MNCVICEKDSWTVVHNGLIRQGKNDRVYGNVLACTSCSFERLENFYNQENYKDGSYWDSLIEGEWDFAQHDITQLHHLAQLPSLRGLNVVEIGCGDGSFLDLIDGVAGKVTGVELDTRYQGLDKHCIWRSIDDIPPHSADIVLSFDVIEHTENPVEFLKGMATLIKPDGRIFVTTPNNNEVLVKLSPMFREYRYMIYHNWYFTAQTLGKCARKADLAVMDIRTIHRFGISNTFRWLQEGKPAGYMKLPYLTGNIDEIWKSYLNREGLGETLLIEMKGWDA